MCQKDTKNIDNAVVTNVRYDGMNIANNVHQVLMNNAYMHRVRMGTSLLRRATQVSTRANMTMTTMRRDLRGIGDRNDLNQKTASTSWLWRSPKQ